MDLAQRTGILSAPILRPLATSMFFLALVVLGSIAVQRMPIALLPDLEGDVLFVNFNRPGSDPDFIERELLNPLESRARSLPDVVEMLGQINGSGGSLTLEFEPGTDIKVRLNELTQIASKLEREQPLGTTFISASSQGTSGSQNFVLNLAVYGGTNDPDVLFDLATEHVAPRLAAAPGVSRAMISGGSGKQVTVIADPARGAILGVTTSEVTDAVERTVGRPDYLGNVEDSQGQTDIILDGRVSNIQTLANAQIKRDSPAQIRHVGEVEIGYGRHTTAFRVNGEAAVGISVFQEQGANLLMVAKALNEEIAEVRTEVQSLGLELVVLQDGAEVVEKQVDRLMKLSLIGFVIALAVLFLFLRQWRAVVVVGISVPVSVVLALASLYLLGYGINLVTLFGLAVSVGLLVDNSVVVYEAILRSIERGAAPEVAVRNGLKRTVRAIIAASVTTAIVFLPLYLVDLDNTFLEEFSKVIAAGLLLPLFASLLVAVGLVPLLAHRLAAPAAVRRVAQDRIKRAQRAGILAPDRLRLLLTGFSRLALRHPPSWLTGTAFAIVVTLFLVPPWVFGTRSSDSETIADSVELVVVFNRGTRGLDATSTVVKQLEDELSQIPGVDRVVANVSEDQGELTVFFVDEEQRPDDLTVGSVRNRANQIGDSMPGVDVRRPGEEEYKSRRGGRGGASFFGGAANEVVISGPDSRKLMDLGEQIREQLRNTQYIDRAWLRVQRGNAELVVSPNRDMFESLGLRLIQIFPVLNLAGNEGSRVASNFSMSSGREIPIFVERTGARDTEESLSQLRRIKVPTASGLNVTLNDLATTRVMQPPATIVHRNGRREMKVGYRLSNELPDSGPTREAAVEQISEIIRMVPRPTGYSVEIEDPDDYVSTISKIAIPVLLFLYLVLAITFESLSLPLLVMLAIPLTMLGSLWALFLTGKGLDPGVLVGFVALFGITVNPAILLVDRMQRRQLDAKWSAGAAAFASVSERTRPILLTTATTIAALIPLSITTGDQNEIWPGFAVTVIGGLITSALLTLLVIPVGYILFTKLDRLFGRVGPWLMVSWAAATLAVIVSLVLTGLLESWLWIVVCSALVGMFFLAIVVLAFRRVELPEPDMSNGPPSLEVSHLRKIYGLAGPIRTALNAHGQFSAAVLRAGGKVFSNTDAVERTFVFVILTLLMLTAAYVVDAGGWCLFFLLVASGLIVALLNEIRRLRGYVMDSGTLIPGRIEQIAAYVIPWLMIASFSYVMNILPLLQGEQQESLIFWPVLASVVVALMQILRRSAVRQIRGELSERATGFLRYPRTLLRKWARRVGGLDIPQDEVHALTALNFKAERGMIGILGPNGAGKTTLLRQLAGILEPTGGVIKIGGVPINLIRKYLANWIGYLPQDAGLPPAQSAKEYLLYYAALYDLPEDIRHERVDQLLDEVGLSDKAEDTIGSLSGGMRQRVAVARTLLRLPPIIIVDEPTVGLDPRERIRFRNLLSRLAQDRIVLFSTHVVDDVAVACDRVLVLAGSRLKFDDSPTNLATIAEGKVWETVDDINQPLRLPTDAFLAEESPTLDGHTRRRILSNIAPSKDATPLEPNPEDGYLWLIGASHA